MKNPGLAKVFAIYIMGNSLGQIGEKVAANYLLAQGYELLDANIFNTRGYRVGEIDLIGKEKNGTIVFFEVKCRKGSRNYVVPEENITAPKIRKIEKAANFYLRKQNLLDCDWRIDAIAIVFDFYTRRMDIKHIKHIRI